MLFMTMLSCLPLVPKQNDQALKSSDKEPGLTDSLGAWVGLFSTGSKSMLTGPTEFSCYLDLAHSAIDFSTYYLKYSSLKRYK